MSTRACDIARAATKHLRNQQLLSKVPKTEIAARVGIDRMTLTRHLEGDDMMLSEILDVSEAVGADPLALLADAIKQIERTNPALANKEVV